jgi:hypothetical protein
VRLHGVGNWSPTRRGGGVRAPGSRLVSWPTPQSESGEARGGDWSCEAETCRVRWRLVGEGPSSRELVGNAANRSGA